MKAGKFTVICGPMFAGKTTLLLDLFEKEERNKMLVKPRLDQRYSKTEVVTHDGKKIESVIVNTKENLQKLTDKPCSIFIDEIHFLGPCDYEILSLLKGGNDVTVAGLDLGSDGHLMPQMEGLMGLADNVIKKTARCVVCNSPANRTLRRFKDDRPLHLLVGGIEKYAPLCLDHFDEYLYSGKDLPK